MMLWWHNVLMLHSINTLKLRSSLDLQSLKTILQNNVACIMAIAEKFIPL